jgi:iron(III) transport system substrate-binding protein
VGGKCRRSQERGKGCRLRHPGRDLDKLFKEHFEVTFPGIKVESVPDRDATERIVAERRAGKFIPDVYLGAASSNEFSSLRAQGIFQPLRPFLILPEVLDESRWFEGKLWFIDKEEKYSLIYAVAVGTLIAVNTNLINPHEITSYTQLVDPRWRGKIVSNDILRGTSGTGGGLIKFLYLHPNLGPNFLKKLFGEMEVTLTRYAANDRLVRSGTLCDCALSGVDRYGESGAHWPSGRHGESEADERRLWRLGGY